MSYNVFFYNGIENAAVNLAETLWDAAELTTHYMILPYIAYRAINWAFHVPQVQAKPKPQGFFSRVTNATTGLFKSTLSVVGKVVGAEMISHTLNQWWLKKSLWEGFKPIPIAFLRPILERLVLSHKSPHDKNDINFSLREMIPGGEGTWLSQTTQPFVKLGSGLRGLIYGSTTAELLAPSWYEAGDSLAKAIEVGLNTLNDIIGSTEKIGPCLADPTTAGQCYQAAKAYLAVRSDILYVASAPLRASFGQWYGWGLDNMSYGYNYLLKDGIKNCGRQLVSAGNTALWGVATTVEANTKIPAHLIYYVELGLMGYLTYKLARFGKDLASDAIRASLIPSGVRGYFVNNNSNAQPQDPKQLTTSKEPEMFKDLTNEELASLLRKVKTLKV